MDNTSNIFKRDNQFTHPWKNEEIDFVTRNIDAMSYREMSKFILRSQSSIQSKVRFLPIGKKVDKYQINQSFFDKWSTKMAYVLGFIAADGNICKSGNSHMVQIGCDDLDIIEKIKKTLSLNSPIQKRKRQQNTKISYQLRFSDRKIYFRLQKLGITPRKSLTIRPPRAMPSKFTSHYVRGFFDGDGSVWISKRSNKKRLVSVFYTASVKMVDFLYKIVRSNCPLFVGKIQITQTPTKKGVYYSIVLGHRDSLLLSKYLYNEATIYLNRKYNIFREIYVN